MEVLKNPGIAVLAHEDTPWPSTDTDAPARLLARCPKAAATPLVSSPQLAQALGLSAVFLKDERHRMGLGSFKALGAAYVIAVEAQRGRAAGTVYATASAGNHGLSVAAGAAAFGAQSVIFLSHNVSDAFEARLRELGAMVKREGADYEASMAAAARAAQANGWVLLSDSSWEAYTALPHRLMEGYLVLMDEVIQQLQPPPTHIFLQAGVGGLAAACAALIRERWGKAPIIVVVEPEAAPALFESVRKGRPVLTSGPVSSMGRLDCKEPSLIALKGLARDANYFVTITEEEAQTGCRLCETAELVTTPSGAAGVAALAAGAAAPSNPIELGATSKALVIVSEGVS